MNLQAVAKGSSGQRRSPLKNELGAYHNMMKPIIEICAVTRVYLGFLEAFIAVQQRRSPFPDTAVVSVERPATSVHLGVGWTIQSSP